MSNPTTPFSWQMPTSTDLVTDLPADFAVFGQAVATSMADLLGGTTGQVLSKTTSADMDFTWVSPNPGDITAVNVTSPITGGGSSGDVTIGIQAGSTTQSGAVQLTDSTSSTSTTTAATPNAVKTSYDLAAAAIAKSTVTTAGDIIYRNATVPTRLGIGTAGQILTVNSGATAPEWAAAPAGAAFTLLSTTTLSGSSQVISSINQTYKNLFVLVTGMTNATGDGGLRIAANSNASSAFYSRTGQTAYTASTGAVGGDNFEPNFNTILRTSAVNAVAFWYYDYATAGVHPFSFMSGYTQTSGAFETMNGGGAIKFGTAAAISSISFNNYGGGFTAGTVKIYGVN